MLTRARKRAKISQEKLRVLQTVFPNVVGFLGVNDISNLAMVNNEMRCAIDDDTSSWRIVKEERLPTMIGYTLQGFDPELGVDFPLDDVTVSQAQPFSFWISQKDAHPPKMKVRVYLMNELWEETENRKTRDLQAPPPTGMTVCMDDVETDDLVFSVFFLFGHMEFSASVISQNYGGCLEKFRATATAEHSCTLRRFFSIAYACTQRIAKWNSTTTTYPSAEFLMRQFPDSTWYFFPEEFRWEADHADRTTVPEFSYHRAPDLDTWMELTPADGLGDCRYWNISTIPWYDSDVATRT